jgi:DNA-binding transcriptional regulator YiaG
MTPAQFKQARRKLGLSVSQMATMLGVRHEQVRRLEMPTDRTSARPIGPATRRLMQAYLDGYRPADWPMTEMKESN